MPEGLGPRPEVPLLEVLRPGLQTTLQDAGRRARALGVPGGGAADPVALRLANALVGQPSGTAALEITLAGPTLRFHAGGLIALCGAPFDAWLDGQPFAGGRAVVIRAGQTLTVGGTARGMRAVLAVRGGLTGQEAFGSRATDLRSGFGGLDGRALQAGDRLAWSPPAQSPAQPSAQSPARPPAQALAQPPRAFLSPTLLTRTGPDLALRVLPTPEATPGLRAALTGQTLTVSGQVDRMGARLAEGLAGGVTAPHDPARVSLPNVPGAVQLPPDGRPILLLPDAGTHGGYPTPLIVASADLPRLGQLRPGDRIRLQEVTPEEARAALREQERALRRVEGALRLHWGANWDPMHWGSMHWGSMHWEAAER